MRNDTSSVEIAGSYWMDCPELAEDPPIEGDPVRVKVKQIDDPEYQMNRKLVEAFHAGELAAGRFRDDIKVKDEARCVAMLLVDWQGVIDDNGKPVPFDRDLAEGLLRGAPFRSAVLLASALAESPALRSATG